MRQQSGEVGVEDPRSALTPIARRCAACSCRSCGRGGLEPVLDLGIMPLSDGFLSQAQLGEPEPLYPLETAFCPHCTLVQILETVPPEVLFDADYPYFSSVSETLLEHSAEHTRSLIAARPLNGSSLVVEIASNDGYLLKNFVAAGIPVLGIDPAPGPARAAEAAGVATLNAFFGRDLAAQLAHEGRRADVILANNVLAHVADTNGFVEGIRTLLKPDGAAVLEFPYVRDLIDHCEFDTIYHEHLCYFSVHAVQALFARHGLHLNDVRRLPIHGGSLRVTAGLHERPQPSVQRLLDEERRLGVDRPAYYRAFSQRVEQIRDRVRALLEELHDQGRRIAAYGAAAKGTILLNYVGADRRLVEFVVDRNVHKQGRWVPGVRIPILAPQELLARRPDYALLLPWNFRDEILRQQAEYRAAGGKFIVPIPDVEIV